MSEQKYSLSTATAIVIASMIGTGVFASLFFQVSPLPSGSAIMVLWIAGGIVALSGGLCYAELTGLYPRSGGEYWYLSNIYHPALGFSAGICTLVVGFAAPIAGIALNLGNYFAPILNVAQDSFESKLLAIGSIALVTLVQLMGVEVGSRFQNAATIFKLLLIALFIILPFWVTDYEPSHISFALDARSLELIQSGSFFSCLALMYYAYTGWNASVYITSDIDNPKRNLPLSILLGVLIVIVVYMLLNFAFLYVCTFEEISAGGSSVGNTIIAKLFSTKTLAGIRITDIFSGLLSIALLATINAFMITAPRVAEVLGKDYSIFKFLTKQSKNGSPYIAIWATAVMTCIFILAADLKSLLDFIGFALSIFASLSVFGIYVMRWREPAMPRPFKTWGYPITPLIFLTINTYMIYYSIETLYGGNFLYTYNDKGAVEISPLAASVASILIGVLLYYILVKKK